MDSNKIGVTGWSEGEVRQNDKNEVPDIDGRRFAIELFRSITLQKCDKYWPDYIGLESTSDLAYRNKLVAVVTFDVDVSTADGRIR